MMGCHLETSAPMFIEFLKGQGRREDPGKAYSCLRGMPGVEPSGQSAAKENLSSLPCWFLNLHQVFLGILTSSNSGIFFYSQSLY